MSWFDKLVLSPAEGLAMTDVVNPIGTLTNMDRSDQKKMRNSIGRLNQKRKKVRIDLLNIIIGKQIDLVEFKSK
ncbi:hypothetical protein JNL27_09590 [bacterium]|nr:hypothetical protein [bacterium]